MSFHLGYHSACDSQTEPSPSFPESEGAASRLERDYVHRVYEEIARHFSSTRHSPWPHIVEFLRTLPAGSIVADIGCGNGKYLGINKELFMASNCCCRLAVSSLCYCFLSQDTAWIFVWFCGHTQLSSGIVLGGVKGPCGMLRVKPRLVKCKASILPAVL